jgi:hypothetical protein
MYVLMSSCHVSGKLAERTHLAHKVGPHLGDPARINVDGNAGWGLEVSTDQDILFAKSTLHGLALCLSCLPTQPGVSFAPSR